MHGHLLIYIGPESINIIMRKNSVKILAIQYGHNCTVGFSENGEVKCLISEERISRAKNTIGFPEQALQYVIKKYLNGDVTNADIIVIPDETGIGLRYLHQHGYKPVRVVEVYRDRYKNVFENTGIVRRILTRLKRKYVRQSELLDDISRAVGVDSDRITFINHHVAHALSGLHFLNNHRQDWTIFTMDGEGDDVCATVHTWQNGSLKSLMSAPGRSSPGYLFAQITGYLGMHPNEHEFKVMGMAPYSSGKYYESIRQYFKKLVWFNSGNGQIESSGDIRNIRAYLAQNLVFERFDHVCHAIQTYLEDLTTKWVRHWVAHTGIPRVMLAGGVFMNVKACKRIGELPEVSDLFVTPSSGDESLVIGSMVHATRIDSVQPITHIYLGHNFIIN